MSASASGARKGRFAASLVLLNALIAAAAMVCPLSAPAAVGGNHVFDPLLSLTGGTGTSKLDPVPDPGATHPEKPFMFVCGVTVDSHGNVYVASMTEENASGELVDGRIDVFNAAGEFLTEIVNDHEPCGLAVDATGTLYVNQLSSTESANRGVVRYTPSVYPPTSGTSYGSPTTVLNDAVAAITVNRATGHLFVLKNDHADEYGSAAEGNPLLVADIGKGELNNPLSIAVDSTNGDIFVSSVCPGCPPIATTSEPHVSLVYVFAADGTLKGDIDGSNTPAGGFISSFANLQVAVDEASGEVFVSDARGGGPVYRFLPAAGGGYEYAADPELERHSYPGETSIAVANGAGLPNEGNVYVAAGTSTSHLYAFTPEPEVGPPIVGPSAVSNVTSDEARFTAEVNPNGFASEYHFEYVEEATYLRDVTELGAGHGFDHASLAGGGVLAGLHQAVEVSASLEGLRPGGAYRVRAVASNHCDPSDAAKVCRGEGAEARFLTYPPSAVQGSCPNEALRTGFSAGLPDCRAYELVSPADTNGLAPSGSSVAPGGFDTPLASPDGESALFMINGGTLPELDGNGNQDGYRARRSAAGWVIASSGPSGRQSQAPFSGGASGDGYWFWATGNGDHGTLAIGGGSTTYVRLPDGAFRLVGEGPLATDFHAEGLWISPGGSHLIFGSSKSLAAGASPAGVNGIYDRTADGETHVVSLKPDGLAPGAGASVVYQGTSADGTAVAFKATEGGVTTLYARLDNERTVAVADGATTFAGLSADGSRVTYLEGGDVFSFDTATATATKVGSGGKSTVVNVSADGSHVYFTSTAVLGAGAKAGKDNLYVWDVETESVAFIAVLAHADVIGTSGGLGEGLVDGLGLWVNAVGHGSALDPSRTTPDGRVIVFSSHADLTGYAASGHAQIYRYEAGEGGGLSCLSCNPTGVATSSDARLQSFPFIEPSHAVRDRFAPTERSTPVANLSSDGKRAFFESREALVPADVDGVQDVYEWRADGVGACARPAGCLALISSGNSGADNYLYGASASGSDVFFTSSDLLTDADSDDTISIYDARIGGGFPPQRGPAGECLGEACQPAAVAPNDPTPGSSSFQGYGNVGSEASKRCPKGRHKIRKGKKTRCLPRKHHKHHKRAHGERRTRR